MIFFTPRFFPLPETRKHDIPLSPITTIESMGISFSFPWKVVIVVPTTFEKYAQVKMG